MRCHGRPFWLKGLTRTSPCFATPTHPGKGRGDIRGHKDHTIRPTCHPKCGAVGLWLQSSTTQKFSWGVGWMVLKFTRHAHSVLDALSATFFNAYSLDRNIPVAILNYCRIAFSVVTNHWTRAVPECTNGRTRGKKHIRCTHSGSRKRVKKCLLVLRFFSLEKSTRPHNRTIPFTHRKGKIVFSQNLRHAHGILDRAAVGCKRLWTVAHPKQGWTRWRGTRSKLCNFELTGSFNTTRGVNIFLHGIYLRQTFLICGLLIVCMETGNMFRIIHERRSAKIFALMHNMNALVKH